MSELTTAPAAPISDKSPGEPPVIVETGGTGNASRFQATDNPKKFQFTGRATKDEADRLNAAISAHKPDGQPFDIVRLALKMLDYIEADFLQTFKTK